MTDITPSTLAAIGFGPCPTWADLGQLFRRAEHLWDWEGHARLFGNAPAGVAGPWTITVWASPAPGDTRFVAAVCRTMGDIESLLRKAGHR